MIMDGVEPAINQIYTVMMNIGRETNATEIHTKGIHLRYPPTRVQYFLNIMCKRGLVYFNQENMKYSLIKTLTEKLKNGN